MADESKTEAETATFTACCATSRLVDGVASFETKKLPLPELGEFGVRARVVSCGVCHTDFVAIRPGRVPGHEIVATVEAVGHGVKDLAPGDRVGMGFQVGACLACDTCLHGHEQSCPDVVTYFSTTGGFASHVTWDSRFTFKIPDGLESKHASPLLCAGATVYSAFMNNGVKAGDRVAVIGIGGLGHLGLQFARAMGCEVVALSRSADKEAMAREMGAHEFVNTRPEDGLASAAKFDFVLSTVAANMDWKAILHRIRPGGKLCLVGLPPNDISFHARDVIMSQVSVCGSLIGNRATIRDMLKFAQLHNIRPVVEELPLTPEGAAAAIKKVHDNTVRFRVVLMAESAGTPKL